MFLDVVSILGNIQLKCLLNCKPLAESMFWEKMDKVAIFCIYLMLVSMHQVEVKGKINF